MKKIKIAFLGVGQKGRGSYRAVNMIPEMYDIRAVCDNNLQSMESFNKEFVKSGAVKYTDYHKMLAEEELDAVAVSTPNFLHHEHSMAVLAKGRHLFLEKPMALSINHCRQIINTADKKKLVLQIGMELHYHVLYRAMKQEVQKGRLGKAHMLWLEEMRGPFMKKIGDWIIQKKYSGGTFVEKNCHHFDLFRWFLQSEPVSVFASAGHDVVHKADNGRWKHLKSSGVRQDVIDNGFVIVDFKNGTRANLILSMFAPGRDHKLEIVGDQGSFSGNFNRFFYNVYRSDIQNTSSKTIHIKKYGHGGSEYGQWIAFYNSVIHGKDVEVNGRAGMMAVATGMAAEKSAEEKRLVYLKEIVKVK